MTELLIFSHTNIMAFFIVHKHPTSLLSRNICFTCLAKTLTWWRVWGRCGSCCGSGDRSAPGGRRGVGAGACPAGQCRLQAAGLLAHHWLPWSLLTPNPAVTRGRRAALSISAWGARPCLVHGGNRWLRRRRTGPQGSGAVI